MVLGETEKKNMAPLKAGPLAVGMLNDEENDEPWREVWRSALEVMLEERTPRDERAALSGLPQSLAPNLPPAIDLRRRNRCNEKKESRLPVVPRGPRRTPPQRAVEHYRRAASHLPKTEPLMLPKAQQPMLIGGQQPRLNNRLMEPVRAKKKKKDDTSDLFLKEMLTKVSRKKKEKLLDMLMDIEKDLSGGSLANHLKNNQDQHHQIKKQQGG